MSMRYKAKRKGRGNTLTLSLLAFTSTTVTIATTWMISMVSPVAGCLTGVLMFLTAGFFAEKLEGRR